MAHTDRDDARWFWKDHFRYRGLTAPACCHWAAHGTEGTTCWCETLSEARKWVHPYRYESGLPSWWHREERRAERARARNRMQRMRAGHIDPDEMTIDYRRPYYW